MIIYQKTSVFGINSHPYKIASETISRFLLKNMVKFYFVAHLDHLWSAF